MRGFNPIGRGHLSWSDQDFAKKALQVCEKLLHVSIHRAHPLEWIAEEGYAAIEAVNSEKIDASTIIADSPKVSTCPAMFSNPIHLLNIIFARGSKPLDQFKDQVKQFIDRVGTDWFFCTCKDGVELPDCLNLKPKRQPGPGDKCM